MIVDAGPLYAAADEGDAHHLEAVAILERATRPLVVPILVVAEVCHLIGTRLGPEAETRFLGALAAGELTPEPVRQSDWLRIAELVARYADLPLGATDGSLVAAAERLGVRTVVTFDRRHFSVIRPAHVDSFELVP